MRQYRYHNNSQTGVKYDTHYDWTRGERDDILMLQKGSREQNVEFDWTESSLQRVWAGNIPHTHDLLWAAAAT